MKKRFTSAARTPSVSSYDLSVANGRQARACPPRRVRAESALGDLRASKTIAYTQPAVIECARQLKMKARRDIGDPESKHPFA